MLRRFALEQDIKLRIERAQEIMRKIGLGALIIPAQGAPGMMGMAKYFTNLQLWAGEAWIVLGAEHSEPALIQSSSYGAAWNRQDSTTSWVVCPDQDAFGHAAKIARDFTRNHKKVGFESLNTNWKIGEWTRLQEELGDVEYVDVTKELVALRSVKTAFEIEENYRMGRLMNDAFDAFSEVARPGVRVWEAAAIAEEVLRSEGCFWGRAKFSFDLKPETIPTELDKIFTEDDIFIFELVYTSPLGYWSEVTALFSFKPLAKKMQAQLDAQEKVIDACARAAIPGNTFGHIAEITTETWNDLGFKVIGKHTPDCHSIGLDGVDGPSSYSTPTEVIKANMVLSLHPSGLLEGNKAFLISDNFLVTPMGAVRLSPKEWIYKFIEC
jgi:Xaa-Pro aminopeptidase